MKVNKWVIILLTISMMTISGCASKDEVPQTNTIENNGQDKGSKGYEKPNGDFVSFEEVHANFKLMKELGESEKFSEAFEVSYDLKQDYGENGLTQEEYDYIISYQNQLLELEKIKEAIDEESVARNFQYEPLVTGYLTNYDELHNKDDDLKKIVENYKETSDLLYAEIEKETGERRPSIVSESRADYYKENDRDMEGYDTDEND